MVDYINLFKLMNSFLWIHISSEISSVTRNKIHSVPLALFQNLTQSIANKIFFLVYYINGKFACECGRLYKYERNLKQHKKYECGKEKGFRCYYCPYKAHQKSTMTKHLSICRRRSNRIESIYSNAYYS